MRKLAALLALLIAVPVCARDLGVPADKGWQHALTGLILMPSIDGLPRTTLADSGDGELDITAQYGGDGLVTIYLFHPGLDNAALWFDRIETAIRARDSFGGVVPAGPEPAIFARPGSSVSDSLKQSYSTQGGPLRSTAAAVMPVGEWLVVIRVSSAADDAAAISARLDRIIAGIRFPKVAPESSPTAAIRDCTTRIHFSRARLIKPDSAQILVAALADVAAKDSKQPSKPAEPFCRDRPGSAAFGVYRLNDKTPGYWVAFNDAGQAASVSGGLSSLFGQGGFQVTLRTFAGTEVYPNFDELPQPEQVVALIEHAQPLSRTIGKNVTLSPDALKK